MNTLCGFFFERRIYANSNNITRSTKKRIGAKISKQQKLAIINKVADDPILISIIANQIRRGLIIRRRTRRQIDLRVNAISDYATREIYREVRMTVM